MGGWKSQKTIGVKLDPATVKSAIQVFTTVIRGFNQHLTSIGLTPISLVRPVGSVSYVDADLDESPNKVYGDVDYLVSFPVKDIDDATSQRVAENAAKRQYTEEWVDYLQDKHPPSVDVKTTVSSTPLLTTIQLPDGRHVQIDIIVTFPKYQKWMEGRYTPERGRKGLIMGKLYKALGDVITMSIGTEGVISRTRDGKRVPSRMRKDVKLTSVSTDIQNFLVDIAKNLVDSDEINIHSLLKQNPGLDTSNVDIKQFARGIAGLGYTLASHNIVESGESFSIQVANQYTKLMRNELNNHKYKKAATPEQFAMIDKIKKQIESGIKDVDSVLRTSMQESVLRDYVQLALREKTTKENEKLLREAIRGLLNEIGPDAISVSDINQLGSLFSSTSSPLGIATAELSKLVGSVGALAQVFLSGIKSFFSSDDYMARYREIFEKEEQRTSAIEAKHRDAYAAMERVWDQEGWKIPFMLEPGAFIAVTAAKKSADAALDAAKAIVGPRWMSEKVQERMKRDRKFRLSYTRYLKHDKSRRKYSKPTKKESQIRNKNILNEQSEAEDISWLLGQSEIQSTINDCPVAKNMKNDVERIVAMTVQDLMNTTKEISGATSIEDLKNKTGMEIELPDDTNSAEVRKAEDAALKYAAEESKKMAVEILTKHYQEEGLTMIPDGEKIVKAGVYEISKL
ncbi:MAG: hypothetical protein CMB80_28725 [Flammeovirgaceae bacterium]|nr:hypothetical protein [Flammeovirgaceae bacterium]